MPGSLRRLDVAASLANSSAGRIVLHVVAMLSDGELRWHCAGIAREVMS
jgi:hypothetical protein